MPVVYAFGYKFDPAKPPILSGNKTGWDGKSNLHIWCGLAFADTSNMHFEHSVEAFVDMFAEGEKPKISAGDGKKPSPAPTAWPDPAISVEEQWSLREPAPPGSRGPEAGDCWTIYIDPAP
jgi:hypothetical protein